MLTARGLDAVVAYVVDAGAEPTATRDLAEYIADRCGDLALSTVHSGGHSSLQLDSLLINDRGLTRPQISAWLALLRGTRAVRHSDGKIAGGCASLLEVTLRGTPSPREEQRFRRLAQVAAGSDPGCRRQEDVTPGLPTTGISRPTGDCARAALHR